MLRMELRRRMGVFVLVKGADALAFVDVHFKSRVIVEQLSAANLLACFDPGNRSRLDWFMAPC
jgi:hypothetical protein